MNPSRTFILRPVATALLTAGVLLAGMVAYLQLPVSALPQVDYPTIQIVTFYPGASPDVMASSVTTPLERQFGQLPGLKQMTSTSSFGASLITLQFIIEYQIDVAEQQVQAAINAAATFLPRDLPNPPVYSKVNPAGPRQSFTIGANDQIFSAAEYQAVVVTYRNGAPVRLADVATVIDGVENTKQAAWMNDKPAVIVNIQRQPGANIIGVVDRIKRLLPQLKASLPSSVEITTLTDRTATIRASVHDVEFTLVLTIALVVMVMFLFLRLLAATVIPSVAVPISIVGTFGVMYLLGYSLDNLSLMALTISTGFLVDDAIVMIENINRFLEAGHSPLEAALQGSGQIGFTIISLTFSLIAVLIPLLFMGDIVGRLFREFAVTLSVTILVSAVVSLTLTPMMCAKLLKHKPPSEQGKFYRWSETVFDRVIERYGVTLRWVLRHQEATLLVAGLTLVATILL